MSRNGLIFAAGLLGLIGVMLGAFGAHALHGFLQAKQTEGIWQTAIFYHLIHTAALLAVAGWQVRGASRLPPKISAAAICWISGIVLFSGSLYGLALGGPRALGPITPVGGLFFLTGWVLIMLSARQPSPPATPPA